VSNSRTSWQPGWTALAACSAAQDNKVPTDHLPVHVSPPPHRQPPPLQSCRLGQQA
jgi:hypothetical protein